MDQVTVDAVKEVVDGLTSQGELFSSYDVTLKLRNEKSMTVYHSEVRKAVHAMFANLDMPVDYERDDFNLPSGKTTIVFHPRTKSTTDYDPMQFGSNAADPFGQKPTATQTQTAAPNRPKGQLDGRGRFCISNKLTRQLGYTHGCPVFVDVDCQRILVGDTVRLSATFVRRYKVDRDGNIRLSQKMLKKAGLSGKALTAKVDGSTIVVE